MTNDEIKAEKLARQIQNHCKMVHTNNRRLVTGRIVQAKVKRLLKERHERLN